MRCIVCGKSCEVLWDDAKGPNVPAMHDGIVCYSSGNYGSRHLDPLNGGVCIRFALCDDCLVAKGDDILHIVYDRETTVVEHSRTSFTEHLKQERHCEHPKTKVTEKGDRWCPDCHWTDDDGKETS